MVALSELLRQPKKLAQSECHQQEFCLKNARRLASEKNYSKLVTNSFVGLLIIYESRFRTIFCHATERKSEHYT